MSDQTPWGERLADRLNPIVVKEVRQGLRTRAFWVFFGLMLLACLVISLFAFAASAREQIETSGQYFFFAYFLCLGGVHFLVIPYTAYRSLAREREDETWVLLTLTGLGPRRILIGKVGSFLTQAALYGSAAGPFLLFSYYLNGIDLPTILVVLALGGAYQAFLTTAAVCAATLAEQRLVRGLVHFALLGALLMATANGLGLAFGLVSEGHSVLNDRQFPLIVGAALWAMVSYAGLLFEAAAARLSLASENYARGPRLAFVGQLVVTAGIFVWLWWSEGRIAGVALVAQAVFCVHLTGVGFFLCTDVDGMVRRHRSGTRAPLLRPGALRGFRLVMLALATSTALWAGLYKLGSGANDTDLVAIFAMAGYVALFLAAPLFLSRACPWPALRTPVATRLLCLGILILAVGLPPLLGALLASDPAMAELNLLNPVVGMVNFTEHRVNEAALVVLGVVALSGVLAADRALAFRDHLDRAQGPG